MKGSIGRQSWEEEACFVWEKGRRQSLPHHLPSPAAVGLSYKGLPTLLPGRAALWIQANWVKEAKEPSL